jgi:hypothetical protein
MRQTRKHLQSIGQRSGGGWLLYHVDGEAVMPKLHMGEDGIITRYDVDLSLTKAMTVKEAYKALGIN